MRNITSFALAIALLTTASGVAQAQPARAPGIAHERIDIRVYETGMMPAADQTVALRAAAGVLAAAGIDVTWVRCVAGAAAPACETPLGGADLSVRFARLPAQPSTHGQLQLGYSLVDTRARDGKLATVFVDRVQWLAAQAGSDSATLLGFAVAHEIGHLLLGTNAHGTAGLMRAIWSRAELQRYRVNDWLFSPREASSMRTSLLQRKGLRSPERHAPGCSAARRDNPDASAGCRSSATAAALRGMAAGSDR